MVDPRNGTVAAGPQATWKASEEGRRPAPLVALPAVPHSRLSSSSNLQHCRVVAWRAPGPPAPPHSRTAHLVAWTPDQAAWCAPAGSADPQQRDAMLLGGRARPPPPSAAPSACRRRRSTAVFPAGGEAHHHPAAAHAQQDQPHLQGLRWSGQGDRRCAGGEERRQLVAPRRAGGGAQASCACRHKVFPLAAASVCLPVPHCADAALLQASAPTLSGGCESSTRSCAASRAWGAGMQLGWHRRRDGRLCSRAGVQPTASLQHPVCRPCPCHAAAATRAPPTSDAAPACPCPRGCSYDIGDLYSWIDNMPDLRWALACLQLSTATLAFCMRLSTSASRQGRAPHAPATRPQHTHLPSLPAARWCLSRRCRRTCPAARSG